MSAASCEIRRVVQKEIESPLSSFVLSHGQKQGRWIRVRVQDDVVVFADER